MLISRSQKARSANANQAVHQVRGEAVRFGAAEVVGELRVHALDVDFRARLPGDARPEHQLHIAT